MNVDFVAARHLCIGTSIDGKDDTLSTKLIRAGPKQIRVLYGSRIERCLVCTSPKRRTNIFHGTNTTANRDWDKDLFSSSTYHVKHSCTFLIRCGDVEKCDLIGPFLI